MKACKSRDFETKTTCVLGVVNVIPFGYNSAATLLPRDLSVNKFPTAFLNRLSRRPEKFTFLQCACALARELNGHCSCLSCRPRTRTTPKQEFIWNHEPDTEKLGESRYCCCEGNPRLTTDLMSAFDKYEDKYQSISDLINSKKWVKHGWFSRCFSKIDYWQATSHESCSREALESLANLLNHKIEDVEKMEIFYLELAGHLILNITDPDRRSCGVLTSFLPRHDQAEDFAARSPLGAFLTKLADLSVEIIHNPKDLPAYFCIDVANMVFRKFTKCLKSKTPKQTKCIENEIPKFTKLAEARIYAALLGFGAISARGLDLKEFLSKYFGQSKPELNEKTSYLIREGKIYDRSGDIQFNLNPFITLDGKLWSEIRNLSKSPKPRAKENPMYYLDRMEDAYQYNKPECKGWRSILSQDPHLGKVIERPGECDCLDGESYIIDHDNVINAKRYFDSLPEDEGSRAYISSKFIATSTAKKGLAKAYGISPSDLDGSVGPQKLERKVSELIMHAYHSDEADKNDLEELGETFNKSARQFYSKYVEDDTRQRNSLRIHASMNFLDELDYLKFKKLANDQRNVIKQNRTRLTGELSS